MKYSDYWRKCLLLGWCLCGLVGVIEARQLKVFAIGNSFAMDATEFLPKIAQAGGQELKLRVANKGGASLEDHWKALTASLADPKDPSAHIYDQHSLPELMGDERWDIITIQQYSMLSGDAETYAPYAERLVQYLKKAQPSAEIMIHQTWPYRCDSKPFGQVGPGRYATDEREMWEKSRDAYRRLAHQFSARLLPVGDAFWFVDSDPGAAFRPDASLKESALIYPALPAQKHSLHRGYMWSTDASGQKRLQNDTHHCSPAGKYLAALVWYGVLFRKSPDRIEFIPTGVDPEFAFLLRRVAARAVRENEKADYPGN